jgi:hypothetical protein
MNINEIKLSIIMCPAEMFANNRIIKANGFVKIPTISIGIIIGISAKGTPGGLNICPQYDLLPEILVTIKVIKDNTKVMAILPVTLAAPGSNPNKLLIRMKKNKVSK